MKKISLILVIVLLGCQDVITPSTPFATDSNAGANNSELSIEGSTLLSSMTDLDQKRILSELESSGYSLTTEQVDALIKLIDAAIPVVYSLKDQIPPSLRTATSNEWEEIAKHDSEAAAFVQKVKTGIEDNLTIEVPPNVLPCYIVIAIFVCLQIEIDVCYSDIHPYDPCITFTNIARVIECILQSCLG
ncbi:MAG TPA: hypothetical protein VFU05_17315 [Cyclobacteriaceae bacterium]|nr:hypothetical protein [Cyclobacteriaceae bacterium]